MSSGANHFYEGQRVSAKVGDRWHVVTVARAEFSGDIWITLPSRVVPPSLRKSASGAHGGITIHIRKWMIPNCIRPIALVQAS